MIAPITTALIFIILAILITIVSGSYVLGPAITMVIHIILHMANDSKVHEKLDVSYELWIMLLFGVSTIFSYTVLYDLTLKGKHNGSKEEDDIS